MSRVANRVRVAADAGAVLTADAAAAAPLAACGCGVTPEPAPADDAGEAAPARRAVAVDPGAKARNQTRLRRIEGQVRGLQKMVEEDRYCADVLTQIASVQEALRAVGRELMRNHLRHCATATIRGDDPEAAERVYDEILTLMDRAAR